MQKDLSITEMFTLQKELFALHENKWSPMSAEYGRNFILFMIEEIGECIAIIKKKGDQAIVSDAAVRSAFLEEMSDVLMYYCDTLLRYGVTAEEFSEAYLQKHQHNMERQYQVEYASKYSKQEE